MQKIQERPVAEIEIPWSNFSLRGELIIPPQASGVVLFAHGSGSSRHSPRNQYVARTLREHHIGTLLFDLLTLAEEQEDRVTGHIRFDVELLAQRLLGATSWLHRQHPELALGYFGASTGGGAALVAAAQSPDLIRAVVSRGGRPDLAGPALERVNAPTLLIVGENDTAVIELNREAYARMRCLRQIRLVPGAGHLFEESGALERVAILAAEWFERHFA